MSKRLLKEFIMKKITVLTIVLVALSLNLSAFDEVTDTSKSSTDKKHKMAEDTTTVDKYTKPTKSKK